jgi:hypothetical protein
MRRRMTVEAVVRTGFEKNQCAPNFLSPSVIKIPDTSAESLPRIPGRAEQLDGEKNKRDEQRIETSIAA